MNFARCEIYLFRIFNKFLNGNNCIIVQKNSKDSRLFFKEQMNLLGHYVENFTHSKNHLMHIQNHKNKSQCFQTCKIYPDVSLTFDKLNNHQVKSSTSIHIIKCKHSIFLYNIKFSK
jgi:hypothetical protein